MQNLALWVLVAILALQTGLRLAQDRPRTSRGQAPDTLAPPAPPPAPSPDTLQTLSAKVAALEVKVQGLPSLWAEEADRAQRAAEREEKAARRDRGRRRSEEAGPELEFEESDAPAGGSGSVYPLHAHVAGPTESEAVKMQQARRALALNQIQMGSKGR